MRGFTTMAAALAALCLAAPAGLAQEEGGENGRTANAAAGAREATETRADRGVPSQYRRERGRVVGWMPVAVESVATPNVLVLIDTGDGRHVVGDIGQDTRGMDLARGAMIAVRGEAARVGPRHALILADVVRSGRAGRTFDIDRPARVTKRAPSDMRTPGSASADGDGDGDG